MHMGPPAETIDRRTVFWALLSGFLLFLSFPKFGTGFLAWIALIPLLHVLQAKKPSQALLTGFLSGFAAYVGIIYWIAFVVVNYGYLPLPLGIAVMLLLCAYLSLYTALFAAAVVFFRTRGISPIVAAPPLWTSLEYAKSHLLTGFPWENLGYSQYTNTWLIQVADITGVFGLSFIIVAVNAVLFDMLRLWRLHPPGRRRLGRVAIRAVSIGLLMSVLLGYGSLRVREVEKWLPRAPELSVSLIQGNIDQSIKWHPAFQDETIRIYASLTRQAAPSAGGLIVWPETATPFFFQELHDLQRRVSSLPVLTGSRLLFGSPSYSRIDSELAFFNSAFLLSEDGGVAGRYDKVHLVPYGEYVPLRRFFPFISKLVVGVGDFRSGPGYVPLIMQDAGVTRKIGIMICYEGILPESGRSYRRQGTNLLVNITNDAWFGNTSAPHQHLSMTIFRSVENRLFLVRAANTGISAIIDPAGRILARSALLERTALQGTVRFLDRDTFYAVHGDLFVYGCILGLILIMVRLTLKRSKHHV